MKELNKINNELKGYINEANFISNKCRNKLIIILGEEFGIEFELDNYANIKLKKNKILKKKDSIKNNKKDIYNIINIFIILGILLVFLFVIFILINTFLSGNYYNFLWLIVFILPMFVPNLKENLKQRLEQAKNYFKRRFKK